MLPVARGTLRKDEPRCRGLREDVPARRKPVRIVEGAATDALPTREPFEQQAQVRAAMRAEADGHRAAVRRRAVLVAGDVAAIDADLRLLEDRLHEERAARQALTETAVADRGPRR